MQCLLFPVTFAKPEILVLSWTRLMHVKLIFLIGPTSTLHSYKRQERFSSQHWQGEETSLFSLVENTMLSNKLSWKQPLSMDGKLPGTVTWCFQ